MEKDSLLAGRCLAARALKFYLCHDCLQSHLDMLDDMDGAEAMEPKVRGKVKMFLDAKRIFRMLDVGSFCANGTKNGKSYLIQVCLI